MVGRRHLEGNCMTDAPERGDDRSRGVTSREGVSEDDHRHPIKRSTVEPSLSPPAEDANQPTSPEFTDGMGPGGSEVPDAAVPSGDPQRESDRTDLQ
jgi:hypothetical protein